MGLKSSCDVFCQWSDMALAVIPNVKKLVDYVLIFGSTKEELLETIRLLFGECREWNITLAEKKFPFGNKVKFAGFILNQGPDRTLISLPLSGIFLLQRTKLICEAGWASWTSFPLMPPIWNQCKHRCWHWCQQKLHISGSRSMMMQWPRWRKSWLTKVDQSWHILIQR